MDLLLTPTERRLMDRLSDGQPHKRDELRTLFNDELAVASCLKQAISNLRKKLHANDGASRTILCVNTGAGLCYQLVIRIVPDEKPETP